MAFTHLNAHSSRSHGIVMLTIVKRRRNGMNKAPEEEKMKVGKLFIVVRSPSQLKLLTFRWEAACMGKTDMECGAAGSGRV